MTTDLPPDDHHSYGVGFLRRVIDSTHDAVIAHRAVRDDTGQIIDFEMTLTNRQAQRVLGPDWVGRRLRTHLPNTLADGRYQLLHDTVISGKPQTLETESVFRDGTVHRLRLSAASDGDDVVVSLRDITQEYEALAQSEQRYRELVEHQAELVCRFLPDTTILFAHEAYARYHGSDPNELVGSRMIDLVAEERRPHAMAVIASLSPERSVVTDEGFIVDPDGNTRWQQWTTTAVAIDDGRVTEVQAVGIDITARKAAEAAERERAQALALVAAVTQRFIDLPPDQVDTGIAAALADMGQALNVDRAYVLRFRPDRHHLDMTHEWCAPGIESIQSDVTKVDGRGFPRAREHLVAGKPLRIDSVADLDEDWSVERQAFEGTGVRSTLSMPWRRSGAARGRRVRGAGPPHRLGGARHGAGPTRGHLRRPANPGRRRRDRDHGQCRDGRSDP